MEQLKEIEDQSNVCKEIIEKQINNYQANQGIITDLQDLI